MPDEPILNEIEEWARTLPIEQRKSGRRESEREVTKQWLYKHGLWMHPQKLYMRQVGDRRTDVEVKRELLAQIRKDGYEPIVVLDDRASVVAMWREEKLTCLQVAEGDF